MTEKWPTVPDTWVQWVTGWNTTNV